MSVPADSPREFGRCTDCGRQLTTEEAIRSDACMTCDPPADSPRTPAEHVQSGREALDKLVEGLDTVRVEHARAYREVCDSLAALVALADGQQSEGL